MSKIEDFLTTNEEQAIIAAIREAEKNTSGEIRVHLEKTSKIDVETKVLTMSFQMISGTQHVMPFKPSSNKVTLSKD